MALSEEVIVETAHRLLCDYGLQDVSMRRIAAELQVRPGALYYHVPSKQELLGRIAARILHPLDAAAADVDAAGLMEAFRDLVLPVRDGGDLMLIAFSRHPELPPVPGLRRRLLDRGLAPEGAEQRAGILMRFALGAVAAEQNGAMLGAPADRGADDDASDGAGDGAGGAGRGVSAPAAAQTTGGAALYREGLRLLLS